MTEIFSTLDLARRLERAEGRANVDFVETRKTLFPKSGACWTEVAGTYAMFDGVGSPLTQTFGLGLFEPPSPSHLAEIEQFFRVYKDLEGLRTRTASFGDRREALEVLERARARVAAAQAT